MADPAILQGLFSTPWIGRGFHCLFDAVSGIIAPLLQDSLETRLIFRPFFSFFFWQRSVALTDAQPFSEDSLDIPAGCLRIVPSCIVRGINLAEASGGHFVFDFALLLRAGEGAGG